MTRQLFRLLIGFVIGLVGVLSYCTTQVENPITGEQQRIRLSPTEEVQLGLQTRGQLAQQFGGLYPDASVQESVQRMGQRIVQQSVVSQSEYPFEFHVLQDSKTVNAFALPGGQIFITNGLLQRLNSPSQLAGILGHEIGHVVARHGAEHLAKRELGSTLVTAVGVATTDDQGGGRQTAAIARVANEMVALRYGREAELESDRLGVQFMAQAGYDPRGMIEVMEILGSAQSGSPSPEFLSTHPNPDNRIQRLEEAISEDFPNGIPPQLESKHQNLSPVALLHPVLTKY
ncbi:M48 family metallopeptidase [Laspinema sp. D1]|uniref:M48 family metalloprotease n=1 Tax=Laspinema palackyanum TaxID=3231601 RepID=UPI00346B2C73|nr:M48 family metallopeptidase [Laspinema sp. D2b]